MSGVTEGYRTRVRPGAATAYRDIHASIPDPLAAALVECGLISWRIWIDGDVLFHAIETRDGRERMVERMAARPTVDPDWDALISTLVDDAEDASRALDPVWVLEAVHGQRTLP